MPRMDIIDAWNDGYKHGAADSMDGCTCRDAPAPPVDNVVRIEDYLRARRVI